MAGRIVQSSLGLISALSLTVLSAGLSQATAMTIAPLQSLSATMTPAQKTTFWGRPYPYGYAYNSGRASSCYVRRHVHGAHGWYWKRVYVCGGIIRKD